MTNRLDDDDIEALATLLDAFGQFDEEDAMKPDSMRSLQSFLRIHMCDKAGRAVFRGSA